MCGLCHSTFVTTPFSVSGLLPSNSAAKEWWPSAARRSTNARFIGVPPDVSNEGLSLPPIAPRSLTMRAMRRRLSGMAVVSLAAAVLVSAQAPRTKTVWDGAYTNAQAERAQATFDSVCSRCHILTGDGKGALTGDAFWRGFTQKTVADLLTYVKTNMPNGNGGSLAPSTYNDLVALILKSNGFPAGDVDVSPDSVV